MATVTMTVNPQKVTNSADTNDHDISLDNFLASKGTVLIDNISGPIRFNANGTTDASLSGVYTTTDKPMFHVSNGRTLHYRGAAGSETFQITVMNA